MTITTATPTASERKRRTRTKRVSSLPAIRLSHLKPSHIDLRDPLKAVLVCVDCQTWVPITGIQGKVQKLVPHHSGKAGEAAALRCRGSNRRIEWDLTIPQWYAALAEASKDAASRRPTAVLPKAFSPRTDQELRGRAKRTAAGRLADWDKVLRDVTDTDNARRAVPTGDPALPM